MPQPISCPLCGAPARDETALLSIFRVIRCRGVAFTIARALVADLARPNRFREREAVAERICGSSRQDMPDVAAELSTLRPYV